MPTYIAMLRGINVSGHKIVAMERLRASFEALGFGDVRTYVQSGNVVFEAGKDSAASLANAIQKKVLREFGFPVPVLLKTAGDLARIIGGNPFLTEMRIDHSKLHVTFLSGASPTTAREQLQLLAANTERFQVSGREIYLYCPSGYGTTKLSNVAIEKKLSVVATTRNWKTVNGLAAMAKTAA